MKVSSLQGTKHSKNKKKPYVFRLFFLHGYGSGRAPFRDHFSWASPHKSPFHNDSRIFMHGDLFFGLKKLDKFGVPRQRTYVKERFYRILIRYQMVCHLLFLG